MDLGSGIDAYLDHLRVERALAVNTVSSYATDLSKLAAFAEKRGVRDTENLDAPLMARFVVDLDQSGLGARSAARHLSAVRGFCRFLVRERLSPSDPTVLLVPPKLGRRLPVFLSFDEVCRLLNAPDPARPRGVRDRAMLSLLYAAGLRVSELCALRPEHVDRQRGFVNVLGKGGKRRLVPVGEVALADLDLYLKSARAAVSKRAHPALFL